jgi:hypothetical protein
MGADGSFIIRPTLRATASVRALFILKAADLLVDEEWAAELASRPIGVIGRIREVMGGVVGSAEPTIEAEVGEPLDMAISWGRPRLTRARLTWTLPVPFTLELVRPAAHQTFPIPGTEPEFDAPLSALLSFASDAGAGAFHWSPRLRRWVGDHDTGAGVASKISPRPDLPLRAAEAEPPATD